MDASTRHKLQRANRRKARQADPQLAGLLGDGNGIVNVPGHPGLVYVRLPGSPAAMIVHNEGRVKPLNNQAVWVEWNKRNRNWRVRKQNPSSGDDPSTDVSNHAPSHYIDGPDPVYIHTRQITPLLAYPAGGMVVKIHAGHLVADRTVHYVGATALDFTSHLPASGARWALIQVSKDGAISIVDGADAAAYADLTPDLIPVADADSEALFAVKLYAGQTQVRTDTSQVDLIDLRFGHVFGEGGGATLRSIWHFAAADGAYRAYEPSNSGLAQANAATVPGDAITIPEGSYQGFATRPGVRYICQPDTLFTSTVELPEAGGWVGGRVEFNTIGSADAVGFLGPAASGIVVKEATVKVRALGSGNAYAIRLQGGWVAGHDAYLRASADDPAAKARLYYSEAALQATCNADQCVYAYAADESVIPANWDIAEGATVAMIGCAWPSGYTPDASISYRPGDRSAINHTHAQLHDALTVSDTSTIDLTLTGQALSAAVIPGGIKLDDLGTPDDNTDLNASTSRHGLLLKLDNDAAHYLNGQGAWAIANTRERLTAARTYYVRTDGNDSNTGLANTSGGAFLTIQKAIDVVSGLDINGQTVTIQIGDGTYTAGMTLKNVVGYAAPGNLVIRGNASNHSAVMLNLSSGIPILAENISSVWTLYDFHVQTGSAVCLYASGSGTTIQFSGLDFGTCATNHIQTNNGASVNAIGDYSISASSSYYHIQAVNRSIVVTAGRTVTIAANLTLVTFVLAENLSEILAYGMTFSLGAYSVTGARYTVGSNSVIYTAGGTNYFPGNSAGVAATGGIYT